eukprot:11258421-Karenia_brevis.AAC.1
MDRGLPVLSFGAHTITVLVEPWPEAWRQASSIHATRRCDPIPKNMFIFKTLLLRTPVEPSLSSATAMQAE